MGNGIEAGAMGRIEGDDQLWQVTQDYRGQLTLMDADGITREKKVRRGNFIIDEEAESFNEGGEAFLDASGNVVDDEGNPVETAENDNEEEENDEDKEAKIMYVLQRRKAEGAYETIDLGDGKKTTVTKDSERRQVELDQFVGDIPGLFYYIEKEMGLEEGFLWSKYGHLNNGQKRMNAGNRLLAYRKKQVMYNNLGDELNLTVSEIAGLIARVGKGAVTENKLRALHAADTKEAEPAEETTEA